MNAGYKIICDGAVDNLEELGYKNIVRVPIMVSIDGEECSSPDLIYDAMKSSSSPVRSACSGPGVFLDAIEQCASVAKDIYIVTIGETLSGSYNSAINAVNMYLEDSPTAEDTNIHVFDSKSAGAGETRVALEIIKQAEQGKSFEEVVKAVDEFINISTTLFIIENFDNFIKNGRVPNLVGVLAGIMNIKFVGSFDKEGKVAIKGKALGKGQAIIQLSKQFKDVAYDTTIVLTYCNSLNDTTKLKDRLMSAGFTDIVLAKASIPTAAYANDGAVIVSW